ncbi:MAG: D-alanyl-D-alanine carboxypeptidase/D-alanyl-D-alanine-endopeptidase [Chitinophagaceae bacterium]|nr:D-alanyl-D-alanine carboxypeptidase/D-alanyl-D-alanine-endopeptidase [Chitinophagaceae bacterium]MCW5928652.1 D-alanyl-D-alanine carboxypeptidase/D-alanyl-D-alanine-endopeptidase [Chitinophagaceae bacterium]
MFRKEILFSGLMLLFTVALSAQPVEQKIKVAFDRFEKDPQLQFAISSLYVVDAESGKLVFQKNGFSGLAPASTQKVITSITALELLGRDYRYKTQFAFDPAIATLTILPAGDPTLGSGRYAATGAANVIGRVVKNLPSGSVVNTVSIDNSQWSENEIPDGWIWQDIGNYYGAGAQKLNWRENKFDLVLRSGRNIGDPVVVTGTEPQVKDYPILSEVTSAARGTGDNAYIYFPVGSNSAVVKGTIPVNENRFVISGALPSASLQCAREITDTLSKLFHTNIMVRPELSGMGTVFHTEVSPALDSIVYWFNRRSINLYGEALIRTVAFEKKNIASADSGIVLIKNFWQQKGINSLELNMKDGSGLSPLNRLTTHAQVEILKYARDRPWFSSFYASLPEYNGMKMKSGTIGDVKGFCGYHTSAAGRKFIFSFLVNNYNGSERALVGKMYRVLDTLK